jgi:hypothetical protein
MGSPTARLKSQSEKGNSTASSIKGPLIPVTVTMKSQRTVNEGEGPTANQITRKEATDGLLAKSGCKSFRQTAVTHDDTRPKFRVTLTDESDRENRAS